MWMTIVRHRLFWCAACLSLFSGAVLLFARDSASSRVADGPRPSSTAEWADVFVLNGRTYHRSMDVPEGAQWVTPDDLGAVYATIQVRLADTAPRLDHAMQDGEATILAAGAPIYAVTGYAPTFRLAAEQQGQLVLYEVLFYPGAHQGHEVLDIGGKVREIGVQQGDAGELGRISDPAQVNRLVDLLVQAPVDGAPEIISERSYQLRFYLLDGTMVSRSYQWDANLVGGIVPPPGRRGIVPAPAFQTELAQAIAQLGAATP